MYIEKIFAIRLHDDETLKKKTNTLNDFPIDEIKLRYCFDTDEIQIISNINLNDIRAIRIYNDGLSSWSYNIDMVYIKKCMLREHNKNSVQAESDMNERRIGDIEYDRF